jgi:hypothetical protein
MRPQILLAIVLIVLGAALLGFRHFSYRTHEKVLDIGPIHATAEEVHTVPIPPIIGWALVCAGAGLMILEATTHRTR